jgi:galactose oxidase-like protein
VKVTAKSLSISNLLILSVILTACSGPAGSGSGSGSGGGPFTIGGTVSGLSGSGLVLQDSGGDNLTITANGSFKFKTAVANNGGYNVTVFTQPTNPTQVCSVTNPSGFATANVTNVQVSCATPPAQVTIGGTVSGLTGSGLVLQNNGGDNLSITANGSFTFATKIANGATYAVTVLTQPSSPQQTCTVTNGSGTATNNVTNVQVSCSTAMFTVGGTVSGLSGTGQGLVLQNNGGDNLAVNANGSFTFKTTLTGGSAYKVTVSTQPSNPTEVCSVANGSGTATANVTNVQVTCAVPTISIGGTVTSLIGKGLVLQNNGGDNLSITASGSFTFKTLLVQGATYIVTIQTEPTGPAQNCVVSNGSGTANANVTNVQVNCPVPTYSVGGTVVGLLGNGGGMELQDNGGDNLSITGNGPFTFATPLAYGGAYNITIFTEPGSQTQICDVFGGSGSVTAPVTNIVVDCGHNDWTWITGSNTSNAVGTDPYMTPPAPPQQDTNTPGARYNQATWTDSSGNLWMFSGFGFSWDSTIKIQPLYLDEMWEFIGTSDYNCLAPNCLPRPGNGWILASKALPPSAPDARSGATTWIDASGKLWLFGGQDGEGGNVPLGLLNDLWTFDPVAKTWTAVNNSGVLNQAGSYGTQGMAAVGNFPGARWGADSWVDASGNFWIFGGQGFDSAGTNGLLNDLWEFNPTTKLWTWIGPSTSNLANQKGVYGSQGVAAAGNAPGGRQSAASWMDKSGNFWLFGGFGLDATATPNGTLNDLWMYSSTANQWTWIGPSSSNAANQHGVYGTQGTAAATNAPGGRWRAATWTDHNGNLWLFAGFGLDASGTGLLNDLWEYTLVTTPSYPAANQWTWVKGSNNNSQSGTYGSASVPFYLDGPGSRWGSGYWITFDVANQNQLWFFGGQGYDSSAGSGNGLLNDLWRFLPYP